jgi:CBS domain-containing protein
MSPQKIATSVRRNVSPLHHGDKLRDALAAIIEADVPALPVVDDEGKLLGIFGEREFIGAVFPGYLKQLGYAGFVPHSLDQALEKRATCLDEAVDEYMYTDHIDVGSDYSDLGLAEIFLHHRVLIIPIVEEERVVGIVTREEFCRALARRLTDRT